MIAWKNILEKKKVLIADGGWGTELVKGGLKPDEMPEALNIDRREIVLGVAASYAEAGADIILTNTFGGNSIKLAKGRLEKQMTEINRFGAEISKKAVGERGLVFGSMGPTGEFMVPLGTLTETEMRKSFAEQAKALEAGGVDGIVIETMTDLKEARAALQGVKENLSLPVAVTMTFDKRRTGFATIMGIRPHQAAAELEAAGADMVGANCGAGIDDMVEVIRLMRPATSLPIWCKPNAGLPQLIDGNTVYRETAGQMASKLRILIEAGASIIGGCCGTTPVHIRAFVAERNALVGIGS